MVNDKLLELCDELEKITKALTQVIEDGDEERVLALLARREPLLSTLGEALSKPLDARTAALVRRRLADCLLVDGQNRQMLSAELEALGSQLGTLGQGRRALRGYSSGGPWLAPAFLDTRQ